MSAIQISVKEGEKIYFASDMHLGLFPYDKSMEREKLIVKWLDSIKPDAKVLFLLGDIFDFWYEYRKVIPKGFTRFLGKLAELADMGVEIHFFTGNHDVWAFDYLPKEIGLTIHRQDISFAINNKQFLIGHGDELCPTDYGYRILKSIFKTKFLQFLFSRLHPNLALAFGHTWSKHSRLSKGVAEAFLGEEKEHQIVYARKYLKHSQVDYFVYGHRHIPMDFNLTATSRLINLGEWIYSNSYAVFDGMNMELKYFKSLI
jgi:UDP-2,3-diacylglucosamine hydrolase